MGAKETIWESDKDFSKKDILKRERVQKMKELTKGQLKILKFLIQLLNLVRKIGVVIFIVLSVLKGYSILKTAMDAYTFRVIELKEWILLAGCVLVAVILHVLQSIVWKYLAKIESCMKKFIHYTEEELNKYKTDMAAGNLLGYNMKEIIAKKEYLEERGEAISFEKDIRKIVYFRSPPLIKDGTEDEEELSANSMEDLTEEHLKDTLQKNKPEERVSTLSLVAIFLKLIISFVITYLLFFKFPDTDSAGSGDTLAKILYFSGIYSCVSYYAWYIKSNAEDEDGPAWYDALMGGFWDLAFEYLVLPIIVVMLVFGGYTWILGKLLPESMHEGAYMLLIFLLMVVPLIMDLKTIYKYFCQKKKTE